MALANTIQASYLIFGAQVLSEELTSAAFVAVVLSLVKYMLANTPKRTIQSKKSMISQIKTYGIRGIRGMR